MREMEEKIILVDKNDYPVGEGKKLDVHKKNLMHRAFSIFIFDQDGRFLLQKRHKNKYHSGSLWTNTCCGHPRVGENTLSAVKRRLKEEMGFEADDVQKRFHYIYQVTFDNALSENEFLHVFTGLYNGPVYADPLEAEGYQWIDLKTLKKDMKKNPEKYTFWFKISLEKIAVFIPGRSEKNNEKK